MAQYSNSVQQVALSALYKSFGWLSFSLVITGIVAFFGSQSLHFTQYLFTNMWLVIALVIAQIGVVMGMSMMFKSLSYEAMIVGLGLNSLLFGISLTAIPLIYDLTSVMYVLFLTCSMFGFMAIYGLTTKHNLSALGMFCLMALIGIMFMGILNIFIKSAQFSNFIAFISVIIFAGFVAYDTQRLYYILAEMAQNKNDQNKMAVYGALMLYMDFINLFLNLLKLLGKKKND